MTLFALECYVPGLSDGDIDRAIARIRGGPERAALGCLVFPDDDVMFFVVAARDQATAREIAERAGVRPDRVAACRVVIAS